MVKTAKSGNPQLACQKHFDMAHPGHQNMDGNRLVSPAMKYSIIFAMHSDRSLFLLKSDQGDTAANHPNQWYQASVQYHRLKNGGPTAAIAVAAGSI